MHQNVTVGFDLNMNFEKHENNTTDEDVPVPVLARSYLMYRIGESSFIFFIT